MQSLFMSNCQTALQRATDLDVLSDAEARNTAPMSSCLNSVSCKHVLTSGFESHSILKFLETQKRTHPWGPRI